MGQTLTYGVYLPDEGERNCYSGLANNWQILDNAVGAIAGKANASHTHGNITNGGAIGSTSGLPVITGNDGVLTTGTFGSTEGTFCEGNDSRLSDARTPLSHTHTKSDVTDLFNTANTWTGENIFVSSLSKRNNAMTLGTTPASTLYNSLFFKDKNDTLLASLDQQFNTDGSAHFVLRIAPNQSGASRVGAWEYIHDGTNRTMTFNATLYPVSGDHSLGTSTNQWKTLNGVNPGALSLPTTDTSKLEYFSGDITDLTGGLNSKSFAMDGWITIFMPNVSGDFIAIDTSIGQVISISGTGVGDVNIGCICPVRAGVTNKIYCKCSGGALTAAHAPCQGNV